MPHPRLRLVVVSALIAAAAAAAPAAAVSSGGYDPAKQGCSPNADDSAHPAYTEDGCYAATLQIAGAKHQYVLAGVPQTPDGTSANAVGDELGILLNQRAYGNNPALWNLALGAVTLAAAGP